MTHLVKRGKKGPKLIGTNDLVWHWQNSGLILPKIEILCENRFSFGPIFTFLIPQKDSIILSLFTFRASVLLPIRMFT